MVLASIGWDSRAKVPVSFGNALYCQDDDATRRNLDTGGLRYSVEILFTAYDKYSMRPLDLARYER